MKPFSWDADPWFHCHWCGKRRPEGFRHGTWVIRDSCRKPVLVSACKPCFKERGVPEDDPQPRRKFSPVLD